MEGLDTVDSLETARRDLQDLTENGSAHITFALAPALLSGENGQAEAPKEFGDNEDEASRLAQLATTVRDQDELERNIGRQADQMLVEQADERDQKRLEKTLEQKEKLESQIRKLQQRLVGIIGPAASLRVRAEIEHLQPQIASLDTDLAQIQQRMAERNQDAQAVQHGTDSRDKGGNTRTPGESQRDFLIRTGKITPFSNMGASLQRTSSNLAEVMMDAEAGDDDEEEDENHIVEDTPAGPMSHRNLLQPGFAVDDSSQTESADDSIDDRPRKRRKVIPKSHLANTERLRESASPDGGSDDDFIPEDSAVVASAPSESDSDDLAFLAEGTDEQLAKMRKGKTHFKRKFLNETDNEEEDLTGIDDGNEEMYQRRLQKWITARRGARNKALNKASDTNAKNESDGEVENNEEWQLPHPTRPDSEFEGGFRIPGDIYPSLFDYQKTGVQWLWELFSQQVGGIIGDEMGLGKTVQIISFLAGLHYSGKLTKPVIVVTPATVMKQWVQEFHRWWPPLRVSILHTSGSGMLNMKSESRMEDKLEDEKYTHSANKPKTSSKTAKRVVDRVLQDGHVLVTTYSGLQSYADLLIPVNWGYAVLDEGHKIRNPNTAITIYCKELRTSNRVILSGTPMQNNLTELWSLFDFIFPMRLGTLVSFRQQFEIPIKQGGYANASNLQVETALKCAETLKDAISPYLLQRFKVDVAADLPKKSEQVLFCKLTKIQREAYEEFLDSNDMRSIMNGKRQALFGIDILRKICNHPDLVEHRTSSGKIGYGAGVKSGKMQVVKALLELWRDTGHKTLLFAQHRIMLDVLEKFIKSLGGFNYRRMDGNTQIKDRQDMVDEFNKKPELHVFLLTTKVGGLGVNLTGADRVIIYDPDWNPSTDVQARERAWRLGQKREVMIYRLMTAGTIEEKIYHRQIFKQFLTNKILRDPKSRQTFHLKDLHNLFTLGDANDSATETGGLFKGTEVQFSAPTTEQANSYLPNTDDHATLPTPPADSNEPPSTADDSSKIVSITGISRSEAFRTSADSPCSTAPGTPTTSGSNPQLLSTIFARSGVHSALEHDAIINGAGSTGRNAITADAGIITREARRIAAQAAKELQRAGVEARNVPVGTPTWTGVVGVSGRPAAPAPRGGMSTSRGGGRGARGGLSSSSVLTNLAARQNPSASSTTADADPSQQQPRGREFMALIRDYLVAHGGFAYTQMLIDHFNRFCNTPARTTEFKEMLRAIAVLDRGESMDGGRGAKRGRGRERVTRGGRARWVLKKEFGGNAE